MAIRTYKPEVGEIIVVLSTSISSKAMSSYECLLVLALVLLS